MWTASLAVAASHNFTWPSRVPETICPPSGEKAHVSMEARCEGNVCTSRPLPASQSFNSSSELAETICVPSGETSQLFTISRWPTQVNRHGESDCLLLIQLK